MIEIVFCDTRTEKRFSVFFADSKEKEAWFVKHNIGYSKVLIKVATWYH